MQFHVFPENRNDPIVYLQEEFEKVMQISYLSTLSFRTTGIGKSIIRRCERADKRGEIERKQKWLGSYYRKEISSGYLFPALSIRWIDGEVGYGVFAEEDISRHVYIGEYTGILRRRKWLSDRSNGYCFDYPIGFKTPFVIDAKEQGNIARFFNHSDTPNLEPMAIYCEGVIHIVLFSLRDISKGAQLTYDYGFQYWEKRPLPRLFDPDEF